MPPVKKTSLQRALAKLMAQADATIEPSVLHRVKGDLLKLKEGRSSNKDIDAAIHRLVKKIDVVYQQRQDRAMRGYRF